MTLSPQEKINIYKSLFRGREDIFAMRWEKADRSTSGYAPVCLNEWKQGVCYKLERKRCKSCLNADYIKLEDTYIEQHLRGQKIYGIYPLLDDNTSYFIVADFDGNNWKKEVLKFYKKCQNFKISTYIERSRSGNGAHVWIFFKEKYPALKSRSIIVNILKEAKIIDQFDKEDSFDRLFPNQDNLSGKGIGNLIALPLQGESRKQYNTIFLNPLNKLASFENQWKFLQNIEKINTKQLDDVFEKFNEENTTFSNKNKTKLEIIIKERVHINKKFLPKILINFLKDNLNFINSEVLIKKKIGVSVYGMEKYFKLVENNGNDICIPRGFLNHLVNFLNENNIKFSLSDERYKAENAKFTSTIKLFAYQKEALKNILLSENGILVAPPGSGKTIIGIELIAQLKQHSLILVHKKQIFNQWVERIEDLLGIPKREIGQICANKKKVGQKITVAMVQTLSKIKNTGDLFGKNKFGLILVDECHHIPAKTFRSVVTKFNSYYLYGLTATPKRKNNDEKLIFIYLGEILHSINSNFRIRGANAIKKSNNTNVIIRNTVIDVPFKVRVDNFQILSKIIIFDSNRNKQIIRDIKKEVKNNSKCLVLTERKEHVEVLNYYLKGTYETIKLTGELTEKQKNEKIKQIKSGNFQILLATGQLIGEGTDFPNLNSLFLVFPFSYHGKLTQYIGRIQRDKKIDKVIYDYRDINIEYLEKFYKKRSSYYRKHFEIQK